MSSGAFPNSRNSVPKGMLLVGHGTRQKAGLDEFFALADEVRRMAADFVVEPCFLELAQPDIATAARRLLRRELSQWVVSPVLLFAAGHAKRDIPAAVEAAIEGSKNVAVAHASPLECHERLVELSSRRFADALGGMADVAAEDTFLLLVGRGNSEPAAIAEMHRFVAARRATSAVGAAAACFAAVAEPSLERGLELAAASGFSRIVVQPHILFQGQVVNRVRSVVLAHAERFPIRQWIVTSHLGPSPLVAEALVDLCRQCEF